MEAGRAFGSGPRIVECQWRHTPPHVGDHQAGVRRAGPNDAGLPTCTNRKRGTNGYCQPKGEVVKGSTDICQQQLGSEEDEVKRS